MSGIYPNGKCDGCHKQCTVYSILDELPGDSLTYCKNCYVHSKYGGKRKFAKTFALGQYFLAKVRYLQEIDEIVGQYE